MIVRDLARRRSNWRSHGDLDDFLRRHGVPGIAGIDTRRLTRAPPRQPAPCPARSAHAARPTDAARPPRRPSPAPTGVDLVATVHDRRALHGRRRRAPCRVVAYDFGIKRTILRHLAGIGHRRGGARRRPRAADVLAREPDGVFLSNGPGDPAAVGYAADAHRASCSARCRCSASASATSCWPAPSGPRPTSCPSATTAATTRCADLDTGPGRDHQPEPQLRRRRRLARRRRRGHPRQPQRRRGRGPPVRPTCRPSACSTTPRPAPAPTTPATSSSDCSHDLRWRTTA